MSARQGSFSMTDDPFYDVVIIGAGISGIGAAYRIRERNPQLRFVILERRERLGGTWDLFRYPGCDPTATSTRYVSRGSLGPARR
ncbi:NAD(P)-binding Rossmann-like domain protein [Mycobacterium xenopi 4042]|uniref:NAD(P)-binding Rossmann-like domain protein n=1 Tax=Mycobacterium xenopi 4042 TaxID=1299334 RepID=X7Z2D3_MYCXE|nr:NAD(P)-binding Rossmann-like domain protein [Mycobacterium xenopi 4042]